MPPWPGRMHSSSSKHITVSTPVDNTNGASTPTSTYPSLEIPTLHSSRPRPETADYPLRHSRSFSHPFPSFLGRKRSDKTRSPKHEALIFDSTDDEISIGRGSGSQRSANKAAQPSVQKEPVTGRCMTCDSTVRWPQGLKVFRCTICLTINDLEPLVDVQRGTPAAGQSSSFSVPRRRRPALPAVW